MSLRPHVESAIGPAKDLVEASARHRRCAGQGRPRARRRPRQSGPHLADARAKAVPALPTPATRPSPRRLRRDRRRRGRRGPRARRRQGGQIKGEEPKKKRPLKKIALFAAAAGAIGVVAKKLQGSREPDNWQSSYTPTPARPRLLRPTPSAPMSGTEDAAGASPDEALADDGRVTKVSTPDEPAEVIDVDPEGESKSQSGLTSPAAPDHPVRGRRCVSM